MGVVSGRLAELARAPSTTPTMALVVVAPYAIRARRSATSCRRVLAHSAGGDAQGRDSLAEEIGVADQVALAGLPVRVVAAAVELDDEVGSGPEAVDLVAGDQDVDLGQGQALLVEEELEVAFDALLGAGGREVVGRRGRGGA